MKPLPQTDWEQFEVPLKIHGQEFSVQVCVFLEIRESPDPYHWPPREEKVTATLETWASLPMCPPAYEKDIERLLLMEIEERYGQS